MSDDTQYIEQQFAKLGRGGFRLKLTSNDDETKWISISPAAAEKIKRILIEDERKGDSMSDEDPTRPYPWTFAELDAMPTLCKAQSQELKIETENMRVWIEPSAADYPGTDNVYLEWLINGRWVNGDSYTA